MVNPPPKMLNVTAQRSAPARGGRHPAATPGAEPDPPPVPGPRSWEPIVGAIGPKVREVRQQLGLSLQQLDVFGKHREQTAHEKQCHLFGIVALLFQSFRNLCETRRDLARDLC